MKQASILLLTLLVALSGCARSSTPSMAIIRKVEASIKPSDIPWLNPPGNAPVIRAYARYYFGYRAGNHRMLRGELVLPVVPVMKPAGIYIVSSEKEFPVVFDGGCDVIQLVYDIDAGRIVSLECNGVA